MKVIELLNKIANGVTYTKKARIRYFDRKNDYKDECILNEVAIGFRLYNQNIELNDEVEILEEKKIPEKLKIEQDTPSSNYYIKNEYGTKCALTKHSKIIADKVNELLDYLESKGE